MIKDDRPQNISDETVNFIIEMLRDWAKSTNNDEVIHIIESAIFDMEINLK